MRTALLIFVGVFFMACSAPAEVEDVQIGAEAIKMDSSKETADGLKMERGDMNGDKKPDVWTYYREEKDPAAPKAAAKKVIVRKEADLNFDGGRDALVEYGPNEQVVREVFDFDFDGRSDQENILENGRVKEKHIFATGGGRVFIWKFFNDGLLSLVKMDHTGDGIADECEEWFKGERIVRTGRDTNRDGDCDDWVNAVQ